MVGALALVLTLLVPYLYRQRRSILYRVWCNAPLLDQTNDTKENKDEPIVVINRSQRRARDLRVYVLEVSNYHSSPVGGWGGTDIAPAHFHRPLSFAYGRGSRVISQQVIGKDPDGLKVRFKRQSNKATVLEPTLLNQGESFTIRVIVKDPKVEEHPLGDRGSIHVDGRIEGIRRIKRAFGPFEHLRLGLLFMALGAFVIAGVDLFLIPLLGYEPGAIELQPEHQFISMLYGVAVGSIACGLLGFVLHSWLLKRAQDFLEEARSLYKVSVPGTPNEK